MMVFIGKGGIGIDERTLKGVRNIVVTSDAGVPLFILSDDGRGGMLYNSADSPDFAADYKALTGQDIKQKQVIDLDGQS